MTANPRVAIYAQSATAPDTDKIAAQIATCRSFCQQQGWDIILTATDEGISGLAMERPGLAQVLTVVASGGVDIVLADATERFARDADLLRIIISKCKEHDVRCHALALNLCASPFAETNAISNKRAFGAATFKL